MIANKKESIVLSDSAEDRIKLLLSKYPSSRSVVMPALYLAQQELGWLTKEAISWVSDRLSMPEAQVFEVATFYTMYYKKPVGRYHIQICRTLSCMLCGARNLTGYIKERLSVPAHKVTEDGFWSFEEVECLGSCGTAPMVQINDIFFENLTTETLASLMDRIEKEKPALRFSEINFELEKGLEDLGRSQIL